MLTIKIPQRRRRRHFSVFIVNFEHIFGQLWTTFFSASVADFEQVNVC